MNQPPPGMIPIQVNFDNEPTKHVLTIKPGNNGWAVFVEEDIKMKRSVNIKELKNNIGDLMEGLSADSTDPEMAKLYRANDKKHDPNAEPIIKLGMHVFKKFEDMQAFIFFVYENQANEMAKAEKEAELATKKVFNSHMQTKP